MSVTTRRWKSGGKVKEAYIVRYSTAERDERGKRLRHIKTFEKKKDALAFEAEVKVSVAKGVHVAPSRSITVKQAGENWIAYVKGEGREVTTVEYYESHLAHLNPRIGHVKLAELTTPAVEALRDKLCDDLSRPLARKVLGSLKMLLKDAKRRGHAAQNVAADTKITANKRDHKIEEGKHIPLPDEVRAIIAASPAGKARTLLMVAAFAGLRASEIRGLRWKDIDLKKRTIRVAQRANRYGEIGAPKSKSSSRTIPIGTMLANTLDTVKPKAAKGDDLVFGTSTGKPQGYANIRRRIFLKAQIAAGVTTTALDKDGEPVTVAKYSGLHALRHFAASWMLHPVKHGGQGLRPQEAQKRLGHSTLAMTMDTYAHLLPVEDDGADVDASERHLFSVVA
jgi:integrase